MLCVVCSLLLAFFCDIFCDIYTAIYIAIYTATLRFFFYDIGFIYCDIIIIYTVILRDI